MTKDVVPALRSRTVFSNLADEAYQLDRVLQAGRLSDTGRFAMASNVSQLCILAGGVSTSSDAVFDN